MVWEVSQPHGPICIANQTDVANVSKKTDPHKYSRTPDGFNIAVNSFLHVFNISFNEFVQGHPELLGKEEQTLNVGVRFSVFPT